jgi:hypothetical protein
MRRPIALNNIVLTKNIMRMVGTRGSYSPMITWKKSIYGKKLKEKKNRTFHRGVNRILRIITPIKIRI